MSPDARGKTLISTSTAKGDGRAPDLAQVQRHGASWNGFAIKKASEGITPCVSAFTTMRPGLRRPTQVHFNIIGRWIHPINRWCLDLRTGKRMTRGRLGELLASQIPQLRRYSRALIRNPEAADEQGGALTPKARPGQTSQYANNEKKATTHGLGGSQRTS